MARKKRKKKFPALPHYVHLCCLGSIWRKCELLSDEELQGECKKDRGRAASFLC